MSPEALDALVTAGRTPAVLDVRSRREFERGHVPHAEHLPFWQTPWKRPRRPADREAVLVVYCGHGPRAWMAGLVLAVRGFRRVTFLDGHYARWCRQGRPTARA
jgi:rhodanese-related sulfurtransferase